MIDQTFSDDSEEYEEYDSEEEYEELDQELITRAIVIVYTSIISVCVMSILVIILYDLSI